MRDGETEKGFFSSVTILLAVLAKMAPSYIHKKHNHPYYQLNHIVKGSYEYNVEGVTYSAGVGDTVLIPSNVTHSFANVTNKDGYYFEMKFSSFSRRVAEICADAGILTKNDEFSRVLFNEAFDENNNITDLSGEVVLTYLSAILFKLSAEKRRAKHSPSKYIEISAFPPAVRDVVRFMENNYKKNLTLDEIVDCVGLKKSYMCNMFKKATTITIFECLMIIRVRKAMELLQYTDLPLTDIGEECGFVNVTHFNRVYTKHVMIPPGQFRRYLKSQGDYWRDTVIEDVISPILSSGLENKKIDVQQLNEATSANTRETL